MDHHVDIFRHLDTSMLEIFQNGSLNDYLNNLSPEEREQTVGAINRLMQRDAERQANSWHRYYEIKWYFNYIPLITIHYSLIWQAMTFTNLVYMVRASIIKITNAMVKMVRLTFFLITIQSYFRTLINIVFSFCDVITFSDNFLMDLFTYVLQDNKSMMRIHEELRVHKFDLQYFADMPEYKNLSVFQQIVFTIKNLLASMLMTSCTRAGDDVRCHIYTNTLIFKMLEAVSKTYPQNTKLSIMIMTVLIYLIYAILGNIICINIFLFFGSNLANRIIGYSQIVKNLSNAIWSTLFGHVL